MKLFITIRTGYIDKNFNWVQVWLEAAHSQVIYRKNSFKKICKYFLKFWHLCWLKEKFASISESSAISADWAMLCTQTMQMLYVHSLILGRS